MKNPIVITPANVPAAITDAIASALAEHGVHADKLLADGFFAELVERCTAAVVALDESLPHDAAEPSMADKLAVGETLRMLAVLGRPNAETAKSLGRVGEWLTEHAQDAISKGRAA